jgi:hypothetical protein
VLKESNKTKKNIKIDFFLNLENIEIRKVAILLWLPRT